jgi:hypothetical protein
MRVFIERARALGVLSVLPFTVACSGPVARVRDSAPAAAASDACPYTTAAQWQAFLDRHASDAGWVKTCEDETCDAEDYRRVRDDIQGVLARCGGVFSRHEGIARCTRNLREFTPAWMRQHDADSYGFNVDNHAYLRAQEAADRPAGMMRPPPVLVAALPLRRRLEAAAREHGYRYLTHDSALGGARTFILVPDAEGRFDQWMLFNFSDDQQPEVNAETPFSFVAVQKKDAAGRALSRVRLHFRDYTMTRGKAGFEIELVEENNGKCYACHASGMRQLIPRRTPILDARRVLGDPGYDRGAGAGPPGFAYDRLVELNARIRAYGMPDWEGTVTPEHHGPALGKAQGCTDCHDGHARGVLTVSTSTRQIQRKLSTELSMPPGEGLGGLLEKSEAARGSISPAEQQTLDQARAAHEGLWRDFDASRAPALARWLLEYPCR